MAGLIIFSVCILITFSLIAAILELEAEERERKRQRKLSEYYQNLGRQS